VEEGTAFPSKVFGSINSRTRHPDQKGSPGVVVDAISQVVHSVRPNAKL